MRGGLGQREAWSGFFLKKRGTRLRELEQQDD